MRNSLFLMNQANKYLDFAEECERLARNATSEQHRKTLREMAQVLRSLAEENGKRQV